MNEAPSTISTLVLPPTPDKSLNVSEPQLIDGLNPTRSKWLPLPLILIMHFKKHREEKHKLKHAFSTENFRKKKYNFEV